MNDLRKQIEAEKENIKIALDNLKEAKNKEARTIIELAAMGTFLSNVYNGIENILKQILIAKGQKIPDSQNWHKDLIDLSSEVGIISKELSIKLHDYLGFRHFFIHGYGFKLQWDKMKSLVDGIDELWQEIKTRITEFIKKHRRKTDKR